ncbi:glycoside hydrolase family 1 protein [Collinsella ureilytica]|uniref:glycoside hydrolase family 1 protein n=1 Tax=Collinsella ureilytica TaxID=2869515 RepID=UPI0027D20483|nr:glycoside hydrolase family 1 protein [Collinsella urealyticum]
MGDAQEADLRGTEEDTQAPKQGGDPEAAAHRYVLPEDFFFGAAMSGPQTEGAWCVGGKLENLWDTWSNEDLGAFYNRVGSYAGNDFMARYREDLALMASLGLTTWRTSIQWSRLLTLDGSINPEGAAWYHELFRASHEAGLECFVNLYHFDMPTYLFRRGGWESREVVEAYAHYAELAFREFGDEVLHWFTFNEPTVEPEMRYQEGVWYPKLRDFGRARGVQYHISLAHSLAVRTFRRLQQAGEIRSDAKIGLINAFNPTYTKDDPSEADLEAVRMVGGINNRWWLDLVTAGKLPADVVKTLEDRGVCLPTRPGDEEILAEGVVDWLGCNYYQPRRVQAPQAATDERGHLRLSDDYHWPQARINKSRGWEIYPEGLYDFGLYIRDNYPGLTWFVSENGMGVMHEESNRDAEGVIADSYRIEFVRDHLVCLARAIEEGSPCLGYHYWGLIDNWSWANAYKNRYGFVEVDLGASYERRPKRSAAWLAEVAQTHRIV